MRFLDKFIYIRPGVKQNFLMWPFLLVTAVFGIAFAFFPFTAAVSGTVIYELTVINLGSGIVSAWGALGVLTAVGALFGIYFRKPWLGSTVSMAGFLLWFYAFIIYILNMYILQALGLALPNMLFWAWWYFIIKGYHRAFKSGPLGS